MAEQRGDLAAVVGLVVDQHGVRTVPQAPGKPPQQGQLKVNTESVLYPHPIKDIQVIKNDQFAFNARPNQKEGDFIYFDKDIQPGESYCYVRVIQEDDQIAWSSPIGVTYSTENGAAKSGVRR